MNVNNEYNNKPNIFSIKTANSSITEIIVFSGDKRAFLYDVFKQLYYITNCINSINSITRFWFQIYENFVIKDMLSCHKSHCLSFSFFA